MTPQEIRAAMLLNGVKLKDIAGEAGVSVGRIHQVIYNTGRNRGYRIRPFIAKAIGKKVEDIWPDNVA
jgi:lambda repressor-like predicted transcriptional regulator